MTPESLTLQTPALLFPAISLLLLAYTNRYLHLAQLIRRLHGEHKQKPDPLIIAQIGNLRFRLGLIKNMQSAGVSSHHSPSFSFWWWQAKLLKATMKR